MIYFIVTTCLFTDYFMRELQYSKGIHQLKHTIEQLNIENYKIIIIENHGIRNTFLDNFGCEVFYTTNNSLEKDKGFKELQDILDCIEKYKIEDTDFIVKMTGRYILDDYSEFMHIVKDIPTTKYDCVIKYGSYSNPVNYIMDDCITGLIGMTCFYVKQIEEKETSIVEWEWAKVTKRMHSEKICIVDKLGIWICPGSNDYFMV